MAEYNIPATTDYVHFADIVQQGRQYALAYIQQRRPDAMPYLGCSALFSSEQLDNPQAQTFGCSPDFYVLRTRRSAAPHPAAGIEHAGWCVEICRGPRASGIQGVPVLRGAGLRGCYPV